MGAVQPAASSASAFALVQLVHDHFLPGQNIAQCVPSDLLWGTCESGSDPCFGAGREQAPNEVGGAACRVCFWQ